MAGVDPADSATVGMPAVPNYLTGLVPTALNGKKVAVIASTVVPYMSAITTIQGLGATTAVVTEGTPNPNPASIVSREFKRDLNAYLASTGGKGAKSLQAIIDYNIANPVEGLKYQQGELLDAEAADLTAYESDKTIGKASNQAVIDAILSNGTADTSDDFAVIMVPSGDPLVGIADRAGYPMLTVPAGEGTGAAGRNPIGVTFVGTAFSEDILLAAAYAFEQASTYQRRAPSVTNPSMYRCVPGSAFFTAELCNPGDLLYVDPF
jgi:amidase